MNQHTTWCDHGPGERHNARQPYCAKLLEGVLLIPEGSVRKAQLWASPTRAANLDGLSGEALRSAETRYNGVELALEAVGRQQAPAREDHPNVGGCRTRPGRDPGPGRRHPAGAHHPVTSNRRTEATCPRRRVGGRGLRCPRSESR